MSFLVEGVVETEESFPSDTEFLSFGFLGGCLMDSSAQFGYLAESEMQSHFATVIPFKIPACH